MKYLLLVMLVPLVKLAFDDFRKREVSLFWLMVLATSTVGISIIKNGWLETAARSGLNLLLLAYLGIGISVWIWIKARKLINPVNVYIGLGDIVFFLTLIPLFPLKLFAWLFVGCMAFSLAWWLFMRYSKRIPDNIPLIATSGIVVGITIIFVTLCE